MNLNIFKNFNFSSILNNASNILNVVKKTIPVYKELKPFLNKEKRIIEKNEIKKESIESPEYNDSLTFFQ